MDQSEEKPGIAPGSAPPALLTTDEVAQILKRTRWAVCSYVRAGKLQAYRIGHSFRFTPQMIENFLEISKVAEGVDKSEDVQDLNDLMSRGRGQSLDRSS